MGQPKRKNQETLGKVIKLVEQLTPADQELLLEKLKLQDLRREVAKGLEQAERGELISGEIVFAELKQRYQSKS